jgi:hypothetical protein
MAAGTTKKEASIVKIAMCICLAIDLVPLYPSYSLSSLRGSGSNYHWRIGQL